MIGLVSQSLPLDSLYPHQARARVRDIDYEIASKAAVNWPYVRMLRIFNLTYAAPGPRDRLTTARFLTVLRLARCKMDAPTSDGLHQLTDSNLVQAAVILRLIKMSQPLLLRR